jgi:hypothetical protein
MASQPVAFPSYAAESRAAESRHAIHGPLVGTIAEVTQDGKPLVLFEGATTPVVARIGAPVDPVDTEGVGAGTCVILIFERGDRQLPIIIGIVRDSFSTSVLSPPLAKNPTGCTSSFELNGRRVVLEGKEEVILRCGLGSLTIRADGQVVIKGTRLMSKASETNKVRGSSVFIN